VLLFAIGRPCHSATCFATPDGDGRCAKEQGKLLNGSRRTLDGDRSVPKG